MRTSLHRPNQAASAPQGKKKKPGKIINTCSSSSLIAEPGMAAWVHNALVDSFLTAYRTFGPGPLSDTEADTYVAEQTTRGVDGRRAAPR